MGSNTKDEQVSLSALAVQRQVSSFFKKYHMDQVQELLSLSSCSWLLSGEDLGLTVDPPPGLIKDMKDFSQSTAIILAPVDPRVSLDYRVVHQIVRELTVGIHCFNQVPFISLEANFDQSTSCQLTPAYIHTKVGQIFTELDYTLKALWHGAFFPKEKRIRFSELWRSSMAVDPSGLPHTNKDMSKEFLTAGLMDISEDPSYKDIYSDNTSCDPTYDPSSPEEEELFRRYRDDVLLKLTAHLSSVQQSGNLFVFDSSYDLSIATRLPEDRLDFATFQRLRQRLALQEVLLRRCLECKAETCAGLAYLRLIAFLVPFLVALKRTMKIPDLSHMLPAYSEDKLKTEQELPPLLLGPKFTCKHFPYKPDEYFHLHGGIELDVGTPPLEEASEEIKEVSVVLQNLAVDHLGALLRQDRPYREDFPVPLRVYGGKSYHVIAVDLTTLYPQPNRTQWWETMNVAIRSLRAKRLPLSDIQLYEQFKKTFGYKTALKCKSLPFGLKAAVERGLAATFHSLCRRNPPSHLGALDEQGYSLAHHAATHNRAYVLCQLATMGLSLNQAHSRRLTHAVKTIAGGRLKEDAVPEGFTPLQLAAQCGSLEALSCLLALHADCKQVGRRGWMAVHFAAYYGQVACLRVLCRKDPALSAMPTKAEYKTYPLLLAASSGSVDALDYLLSIGTDWRQTDSEGNSVVHLAALYFHTHVLSHLLQLNLNELPVWRLLIEMLRSKDQRRVEMSIRCLEALSLTVGSFWKDLMDADGIPILLELLGSSQPAVQCMVLAVLCHTSERAAIREALLQHGATALLVDLLGSQLPELQSRIAVILADLAGHSEHGQVLVAQLGGVAPLVHLLGSTVHDVLVNVVRCIRVLCLGQPVNQTLVAESRGIPLLVELLTTTSELLQEEACAALAELARDHAENQEAICAAGASEPLVEILRGRKMTAQVKAASALEALVENNGTNQARFQKLSAADQLLRLLKVFQLDVREQGAVSLWALAGHTPKQQKLMAELMGYHFILDLLLAQSDRMQHVGCQAVIALSRDNRRHQDGICREVVPLLVRLLRGFHTSERTLLSVILALGTLCISVGHTSNRKTQTNIAEEKAIPILVNLFNHHQSLQVKVQVAQTLACITLGNPKLQAVLWKHGDFSYRAVLDLQRTEDQNICLEAGYALSVFMYNNAAQQLMMLQAGGVPIEVYEPFLQSSWEAERAKAAFQIVILAKVVTGTDQVTLSARGVTILVELLHSSSPGTVTLTAQLLASLAHTRPGIPDAIVTMGAVRYLYSHLYSEVEEVRTACACVLGYLSFNCHAQRILLVECRKTPVTYELLMEHLSEDAKISKVFIAEFRRQKSVGLPSQSLEINGGPGVLQYKAGRTNAAKSAQAMKNLRAQCLRSKSAPVLPHRHRDVTMTPGMRFGRLVPSALPPDQGCWHQKPSRDDAVCKDNSGSDQIQELK